MNPRFLLSVPFLFAMGCQTGPDTAPADMTGEVDPTELMRQKGTPGSANGHFDYCDGATLCTQGEGDCDDDADCDGVLVCVEDNGDNFGFARTTDICVPSQCEDGIQNNGETAIDFGGDCGNTCGGSPGGLDYCHPGCECPEGVGECDADTDCQAGLVCGTDNGAQYGLHWTYDVCVQSACTNGVQDNGETAIDFGGDCGNTCSGANGDQEGYCTPGCPCGEGEGDCDSDDECEAGLSCILNRGGDWGLDPLHDVCLEPFTPADLSVGDLVITELMINPVLAQDAAAEYIELYNSTTNSINLNGLYVQDLSGGQNFTIGTNVIVSSRDYVVLVRSGNAVLNGGITEDYDFPNTFNLANTGDTVLLRDAAGGTELDRVTYNATWGIPAGLSLELSRSQLSSNNNVSTAWCTSTALLPSGDYGSPAAPNRICP